MKFVFFIIKINNMQTKFFWQIWSRRKVWSFTSFQLPGLKWRKLPRGWVRSEIFKRFSLFLVCRLPGFSMGRHNHTMVQLWSVLKAQACLEYDRPKSASQFVSVCRYLLKFPFKCHQETHTPLPTLTKSLMVACITITISRDSTSPIFTRETFTEFYSS